MKWTDKEMLYKQACIVFINKTIVSHMTQQDRAQPVITQCGFQHYSGSIVISSSKALGTRVIPEPSVDGQRGCNRWALPSEPVRKRKEPPRAFPLTVPFHPGSTA